MLRVYLLRHGETTFNADGNRYCGRTDAELTEKGMAQARRMEALLGDVQFDAVYASPLKRSYITAEVAIRGRHTVNIEERLIELDFGGWEGKTRPEFVAENPALWEDWSEAPDLVKAGGTGDTALSVVRRVDDFFEEMKTRHKGKTILVVAHNGVNRLYLAYKLGMPLKNYRRIVQENSALTIVEFGGGVEFSLLKLNG